MRDSVTRACLLICVDFILSDLQLKLEELVGSQTVQGGLVSDVPRGGTAHWGWEAMAVGPSWCQGQLPPDGVPGINPLEMF